MIFEVRATRDTHVIFEVYAIRDIPVKFEVCVDTDVPVKFEVTDIPLIFKVRMITQLAPHL